MPMSTASFTMDSQTFAALLQAAVRRNGFVSGGEVVTLSVPKWTPTILDPNWPPTIDDGHGNQIDNPTPQPQIANVTPQKFVEDLIVAFGTKIMQDDLATQGDVNKIAAMKVHEAAEEAARTKFLETANASIDATVTVVVK